LAGRSGKVGVTLPLGSSVRPLAPASQDDIKPPVTHLLVMTLKQGGALHGK
jgi:hypothetical protein